MAKKSQSDVAKAIDKSSKLASKGKYDEAMRVLLPHKNDSGVQKIIEATRNLSQSVKELKADPWHKRIRWRAKRKGNRISLVAEEKRGCWPFRF